MRRFWILGLLIVAGAAMLPTQAQTTIWVNRAASGCDDAGPGSNAVPKCTIQAGVDEAANGDTVLVLPGTYNECVLAFGVDVDIVADAFNSADPETARMTTIAGTGDSASPCATIGMGFGQGGNASLTGFRIIGGTQAGIRGLGNVTISSNIVENNANALDGGGIYVYSANCLYEDTTTLVEDNQVLNNSTDNFGGGLSIAGGLRSFVEDPGCSFDGNATITVQGNKIEDNSAFAEGGGMIATTFTNGVRTANIVITQNMITSNTAGSGLSYGYGGGIYGKTYGDGTESIEISQNEMADNESTVSTGGALSAWIVADVSSTIDHTITVDANTITGNRSAQGGGGMELVMLTEGLTLTQDTRMLVTGNTITGNQALDDDPLSTFGGGGIEAFLSSVTSTTPNMEYRIEGNRISQNSSKVFGGGISVLAIADGQIEDGAGVPTAIAPSNARIDLIQNRIDDNSATSAQLNSAGAGVFLYLAAQGEATSTVNSGLNTIAGNTMDNTVEAGGIDLETELILDNDANEGQGVLIVNSSIIAGNDGVELGGPALGAAGLVTFGGGSELDTSGVDYSDIYDGAGGDDISPWMFVGGNNLSVDPKFVNLQLGIQLRPDSPLVDQGDPNLPAWAPTTDLGTTGHTSIAGDGDPRVGDGDNDTVAVVDIGADELTDCLDVDLDGFTPDTGCGPVGIVDCDDSEVAVYPGADEICDDLNNDCDSTAWPNLIGIESDDDSDTFSECGGDCDDTNMGINPNAPEVCNGADDNCNDVIDEGFDDDMDGFSACLDDCNDMNSAINPNAPEVCNDIDDNCNMLTDEDADGENSDGDTLHNACDNCPQDSNENQADADEDMLGDVCDPDRDGDGQDDDVDQCPDMNNLCDSYLLPGSDMVAGLELAYLGRFFGATPAAVADWQWAEEIDFNNDGIIDGFELMALSLAWQCSQGEDVCE